MPQILVQDHNGAEHQFHWPCFTDVIQNLANLASNSTRAVEAAKTRGEKKKNEKLAGEYPIRYGGSFTVMHVILQLRNGFPRRALLVDRVANQLEHAIFVE